MSSTDKQINVGAFFRALALFAAAFGSAHLYAQSVYELPRIAHAGGQIGNATYTNSIDALNVNYDAGFRIFEMDFSFTSDQQLVCLHDWEESFERSFGRRRQAPVTLLEFEQLVRDRSEYNKCTLGSLMQWFSAHPQAILVTDVKERNLDALAVISSSYPQFIDRVIPQIYQPDEYSVARDLGYKRIIWTLYLYPGSASTVLRNAQTIFGAGIHVYVWHPAPGYIVYNGEWVISLRLFRRIEGNALRRALILSAKTRYVDDGRDKVIGGIDARR